MREALAVLARLEATPLALDADDASAAREALRTATGEEGGDEADLARWIGERRRRLADVHPRAATILLLVGEGLDAREVADRLGLGPVLVGRILAEAREAWGAC